MTNRSRKGFATYTAIVLMILVGMTLVAVGMCFAADARRTRSNGDEAQLRQLLTAGGVAAIGQLDHAQPTTRPIEIALPAELADSSAKLTVTLSQTDNDHASGTVHAQLGRRMMEQSLQFERRSGAWQPVAATLEAVLTP